MPQTYTAEHGRGPDNVHTTMTQPRVLVITETRTECDSYAAGFCESADNEACVVLDNWFAVCICATGYVDIGGGGVQCEPGT